MHDRSSFSTCSHALADEAQRIARAAAEPVPAGETVKGQLRRAWMNLGRPAMWRVRAAWYGEAGSWSAAAFEDFRARYRAHRERRERRGLADAADVIAMHIRTIEALHAIDPDYHSDTIAALERAIDMARVHGGTVAETD